MTRKRFVKLIMATGKQRNEAQAIAMIYNAAKIPYKEAAAGVFIQLGFIDGLKKFSKSIASFGQAVKKVAEKISKLSTTLKEVGVLDNGS